MKCREMPQLQPMVVVEFSSKESLVIKNIWLDSVYLMVGKTLEVKDNEA